MSAKVACEEKIERESCLQRKKRAGEAADKKYRTTKKKLIRVSFRLKTKVVLSRPFLYEKSRRKPLFYRQFKSIFGIIIVSNKAVLYML
ncbi:MAG: hypothetical protein K6B67_06540, partial [Lachnospiraceae bacterium]|nr:hypothetical protein [Lachnospiraceae bacterium]